MFSMPVDRQSPRLAHMWPIRYERSSSGQPLNKPALALCLNIGVGGMLLLLDRPSRKGDVLKLEITDVNQRSGSSLAQVRWTRRGGALLKRTVLAGVKYLDTPPRSK
jgi:hypothetical protein